LHAADIDAPGEFGSSRIASDGTDPESGGGALEQDPRGKSRDESENDAGVQSRAFEQQR